MILEDMFHHDERMVRTHLNVDRFAYGSSGIDGSLQAETIFILFGGHPAIVREICMSQGFWGMPETMTTIKVVFSCICLRRHIG